MGFKADTSFLKKLTMGATATRAAIQHLAALGFSPIELERYCTSNKIWSTKVKRLRLADLLCVRTGIRFEVRAKSDLQIKMSDSPTNPDRRWDAGLRDDDLIALVACDADAEAMVRAAPVFFSARDLRASAHLARLGPPKSASEGAERDLTWPSIVPSADGTVSEVTPELIRVQLQSGRRQSYQLRGKNPYVRPGDRFLGETSIIAGVPARIVDPATLLGQNWAPSADLRSASTTDRYAAAKALALTAQGAAAGAIRELETALDSEQEPRTALEIAGALARLGADRGFQYLADATRRQDDAFPSFLRMEAVLILSEIPGERAAATLDAVAGNDALRGDEIRQAAVWGLGRKGIRRYEHVAKYVADSEGDVALHAIAALAEDAPREVIDGMVRRLIDSPDQRARAAISAALARIGSPAVAAALHEATRINDSPWLLATLGRLPEAALAAAQIPGELFRAIKPVTLLSEPNNWLAGRGSATDFQFLLQQDL